MRSARLIPTLILALASLIGIWAFLAPFFASTVQSELDTGLAHADDAPLFFVLLLGLILIVIIACLETRQMNSQFVAVLGILVGINATLRLIPGPAGFSAVFFLPILCGYVFGVEFGFLVGALSLLLSALITSGIGPWLPFQMFAAGWSGMIAGWLPNLSRHARIEQAALAGWGIASGFLYGAVMNLWFWPFLAGTAEAADTWLPGAGLLSALLRYAVFYATTSLWWDAARAIGNLILILIVGAPVLRLLRRFYARFQFALA